MNGYLTIRSDATGLWLFATAEEARRRSRFPDSVVEIEDAENHVSGLNHPIRFTAEDQSFSELWRLYLEGGGAV